MEQKMAVREAPQVRKPKTRLAEIGLELVRDGFANPVFLATAPGREELFIVDQVGKISMLSRDGTLQPFLDISHEVVELDPGYDERGLLGLAFHPRYESNRRMYIFYSAPLRGSAPRGWNCTNHLVEYQVSKETPWAVDLGSRRELLAIDKPQMNHNGGHITFGPDGFLYVPLGDGGGSNDTDEGHNQEVGNGQDTNTLLGKILRIDVDNKSGGRQYGIPPDNPFAKGGGMPEIFAYGLRNPYHISFDAEGDHQLFAADAGQVRWEEVDIIIKGGNYGWNIKEGRHFFDQGDNSANVLAIGSVELGLIDPILDYPNLANRTGGMGSVVIGGYVYRGKQIQFLRGRYIFGDFSGTSGKPDGRIYVASPPGNSNGGWVMDELSISNKDEGKLGEYVLSFGQDAEGELYVLSSDTEGPQGRSGRVYKIVPAKE